MVATRAVLGCGGAERRRVPVWRLRAAGIVAARTAHGIFVETREPARCAAPAALAPGAHRPCRRQLPALLRPPRVLGGVRSEEHTSELQSLMRSSYAVFCLKKNTRHIKS